MLKSFSSRKNQNGMAIMELIPIMIIVVILVNYSLGFFGAIHTGILNSMAARNYTFQTFNHRSDLTYFRDTTNSVSAHFAKYGIRMHATVSDKTMGREDSFFATGRRIDFLEKNEVEGSGDLHNNKIYGAIDGQRYTSEGVNPIWVRPQYGICLNSECGPPQ
jgi:hypothetical protein